MSTRTTLLDSRTLGLIIPALTGIQEDTLVRHLQNQEPVHWAIREILACGRLSKVNRQQLHQLLYEGLVTTRGITLPKARLAKNESIRKMYPDGWYIVCPAGVDLALLHQSASQFDACFYQQDNPWFLKSYGDWPDCEVQRIPTEACEIFIPDPSEWLIPGSKGRNRNDSLEMQYQFSKSLPAGWECPEPAIETLTLAVFEHHRQSGQYALGGYNYSRCSNRCRSDDWLSGGNFCADGFSVNDWDESGRGHMGAFRWAVRSGKVGKKTS